MIKALLRKKKSLPPFFKPVLWSYDFSAVDPEKNKEVIIINSINYGDLQHWRWINQFYGQRAIRETLSRISAAELRPGARRLAAIIFSVKNWNDAPRGVKR